MHFRRLIYLAAAAAAGFICDAAIGGGHATAGQEALHDQSVFFVGRRDGTIGKVTAHLSEDETTLTLLADGNPAPLELPRRAAGTVETKFGRWFDGASSVYLEYMTVPNGIDAAGEYVGYGGPLAPAMPSGRVTYARDFHTESETFDLAGHMVIEVDFDAEGFTGTFVASFYDSRDDGWVTGSFGGTIVGTVRASLLTGIATATAGDARGTLDLLGGLYRDGTVMAGAVAGEIATAAGTDPVGGVFYLDTEASY